MIPRQRACVIGTQLSRLKNKTIRRPLVSPAGKDKRFKEQVVEEN